MSETKALQPREKQELQAEGTRPGPVFRPDVDILQKPDGYVIFADLPGVDEGSVDVRLDKGVLSVDAKFGAFPEHNWTTRHEEYRLGSYHRAFRVSEDIDPAGVSASMRNGVLELQLPKSEATRPRSIPVQSG